VKYITILLLFFIYVNAIEVNLLPDKEIKVSQHDVNRYKSYVKQKYNYVITNDKGARKIVKENRILANEFLKNPRYLKSVKTDITIMLEDYLADRYVQNMQHSIKIPKKVLYSYYLDHKDKFRRQPEVNIVRYRFSSYDDALKFYQESKDIADPKKVEAKAIQYGAKKRDYGWKSITVLKKRLLSFIKKGAKDYLTPPIVNNANNFNIYYIKDYRSVDGYIPFEKVKGKIEKILYNQTFEKAREKILERYAK